MNYNNYKVLISTYLTVLFSLISFLGVTQNLIKNGSFEDNNGCGQMVDPDCMITKGNIADFCLAHWETDHGTPNLMKLPCAIKDSNSIVRIIGQFDDLSEGIFQRVNFIPGFTYRLCFWLNHEWTFHDFGGEFMVSLGSSSPGLPPFGDPCLDQPNSGFLTVGKISINSYPTWTKFELDPFTVPNGSNFDRIIFWAKADNSFGRAEVTQIDNITLFKERCNKNWFITQPGFIIEEGDYVYSHSIRAISSNPSLPYITSQSDGNVDLQAGVQIIIKPGFKSQVQNDGSLSLRISGCQPFNDEEICSVAPCTHSDDFGGGNSENEQGGSNQLKKASNSTSSTIRVFPNPVYDGQLNISSNEIMLSKIEIHNSFGEVVLFSRYKNHIDMSSLEKGLYFLKLVGVDGDIYVRKLVKN